MAMGVTLAGSMLAVYAGPNQTEFKGKPGMDPDTRTRVIQALTLSNADAYYALDAAALADLGKRVAALVQPPSTSMPPPLSKGPLPELRAVGAPPQVDWAGRGRFPLVLAEVRSNQREWEVASRQNRHVIVSNLSTGTVQVAAARDKGRRMPPLEPSKTGKAPDAFNAGLSSIDVFQHDLAAWMPREQLQGRLAVTVLDYDLPSNTVEVQATGGSAPPAPGILFTSRRRWPVMGNRPEHAGAAVRLVRAPDALPAASSRMIASFGLPRTQLKILNNYAPLAAAASLVLVQLDQPDAIVIDLAVRIPVDAQEIHAMFSLDLNEYARASDHMDGALGAGNYIAYLVVGSAVAGPVPVRIRGR
jgi:hypothetical protein